MEVKGHMIFNKFHQYLLSYRIEDIPSAIYALTKARLWFLKALLIPSEDKQPKQISI